MPRTEYEQVEEGDWIELSRKHKDMCCDCGLVHRNEYRAVGPDGKMIPGATVQVRCWRDNRATANARRPLREKLLEIVRRIA